MGELPPPRSSWKGEKGEKGDDGVFTVLVTGFGPFLHSQPVNPSWAIASSLPSILPATSTHPYPIRIVVHPYPVHVSYPYVLDLEPKLHTPSHTFTPDIVLHIGLAAGRKYFAIERGARRGGFDRTPDVDGQTFSPQDERAAGWSALSAHLCSGFNLEDVHARWKLELSRARESSGKASHLPGEDVRISDDVGTYLCGFIYYASMAAYVQEQKKNRLPPRIGSQGPVKGENRRPVMFMHVPDLPTEADITRGVMITHALIRSLVESARMLGTENHIELEN